MLHCYKQLFGKLWVIYDSPMLVTPLPRHPLGAPLSVTCRRDTELTGAAGSCELDPEQCAAHYTCDVFLGVQVRIRPELDDLSSREFPLWSMDASKYNTSDFIYA